MHSPASVAVLAARRAGPVVSVLTLQLQARQSHFSCRDQTFYMSTLLPDVRVLLFGVAWAVAHTQVEQTGLAFSERGLLILQRLNTKKKINTFHVVGGGAAVSRGRANTRPGFSCQRKA